MAVARKRLDKFFAVTETSVYEVRANMGKSNPHAEKIALKGRSVIQVGGRLDRGTMIAICRCLIPYIPEKYGFAHPKTAFERRIENVNTMWWRGNTSPIVALFTNKKAALVCFKDRDFVPCDPKWVGCTKDVLNRIGNDHPVFYISHDEHLGLPCAVV